MKKIKDYTIITFGAALYALSVSVFTAPNNIAPGGLTGIATMLNYLFSVPIGVFILIMNAPLFVLGFRVMGRRFAVKTIVATALASGFIDLIAPFVYAFRGDTALACIYGGALNGLGLALIFSRGGSTGGSDIIAAVIHRRLPQFSIGHVILAFDTIVITISAVVYNSFENALYAAAAIFVSSRVIDAVIYGVSRNNGKLMMIITEKGSEILAGLLNGVFRGVTVVDAFGGYSGKSKKMLLCALRPNQVFKAKNIVKSFDKNAFIIVANASEVSGTGFRNAD